MGEELSALSDSFLAAWCEWVPERFDDDVVVWAWHDGHVLSGSMAYFGAITQEFDIHVGHYCRVLCRVRNIDFCFQVQGRLRRVQDT